MSYYQGDFYQGDPFFGGLFSLARRGVSMLAGVGRSKLRLGSPIVSAMPGGGVTGAIQTVARRAGQIVAKHPVLTAAGAAGTIGILGGMGGERLIAGAGAMPGQKGFHMSKARRGGPSHLVRNSPIPRTNPPAFPPGPPRHPRLSPPPPKTIPPLPPPPKRP